MREHRFIDDLTSNVSLTYDEFLSLAQGNAEHLKTLDESVIAFYVENSFKTLVVYIAAHFAKKCILPLSKSIGTDRAAAIVSDARVNKIYDLNELYVDARASNAKIDINDSSTYIIVPTSGSTNRPKLICHSFKNLFSNALSVVQRHSINCASVFSHHLPMNYMAGILNSFFVPFAAQASIIIFGQIAPLSSQSYVDVVVDKKINVVWLTPTIMSMLLAFDKSGKSFGHNMTAFTCTGLLKRGVQQNFERQYNVDIVRSYGLTETLILTTQTTKNDINEGTFLDGVDFLIKSDCLLVAAPWLMKESIVDGVHVSQSKWFNTGDSCSVSNKAVTFLGRIKNLIDKGGKKINPNEIDAIIERMHIFDEWITLGASSTIYEKTVCFYTTKTHFQQNEINEQLKSKLGSEFMIDKFVALERLPRLENGKIDMKTLRSCV